jgi:hypothetical protein
MVLAIAWGACIADEPDIDPRYVANPALVCANDESVLERKYGKPVSVESSVLLSRVTHCTSPQFPPLARQAARIEGNVLIGILVNRDGRVGCVKAISGHPLLIGPTINSTADWTFKPYRRDGEPVSFYSRVSFHFSTTQTKKRTACTEARW